MASIQGQVVLTFPAARAASATLRIASFPSLDRAVHAILPRWRRLHPEVAVELSTRRVREHHDAVAALLAGPAAAVPDVVGISVHQLGRVMALDLEALDGAPYLAEPLAARLAPSAVRQARSADGRLLALPGDVGPAALFYRADLLARAGVVEAELTASWEGFLEAGQRVKAATGAAMLAHPAYLSDVYLRSHMTQGEGIFFSAAGEPLLGTARFHEAFRLAAAARAAGVDAGIGPGWTDAWTDAVRRGAVAGQLSGAWFGAHLTSWIAPEARGLWRCGDVPGGQPAPWGGSFYGIPRAARHKALAFDFIRLACLEPEVQLHCLQHLHAFPALLEVLDDPLFDEPLPFFQGQPARRQWRRVATAVEAGPVHALDPVAEQAVSVALCRVLDEGTPIAVALADAERTIRASLEAGRRSVPAGRHPPQVGTGARHARIH